VQESLSNVHRHSGSMSATLRLRREASRVVLEIEDYGRGVAAKLPAPSHRPAVPHGVGIAGMRQRVDELGGTFCVLSQPGGGTMIQATLPLPTPAEAESTAT
jgi:signal transduction histidine kinase